MGGVDGTATRVRSEIVGDICERIAAGESVDSVFASPGPDFPALRTFWRWLNDDPECDALYQKATARRGEKYAEEIVELIDVEPPMVVTKFGEQVDPGWVAWQRNRIDARKWVAARMLPKRYGDKVTLAGDADNPLAIVDQSAIAGRLLPELAAAGAATPPGEPDTD